MFLYISIKSVFTSLMIEVSFNSTPKVLSTSKYTEPPPKKGSMYLFGLRFL